MYALDIKPEADKIFGKLGKRQLQMIWKKIDDIRQNPSHGYKFLRKPLKTFNRVHIDKHFVLIFNIDHKREVVDIWFYGHHDDVYLWRPKTI